MVSRKVPKLTDRIVKDLAAEGTNYIVKGDDMPSFGVCVTPKGTKSFVLNYSASRRERRMTIGQYPEWSVSAARERASELRRRVDVGEDPLEVRIERRNAPRVSDLFKEYMPAREKLGRSARAANDVRSMFTNDILPRIGKIALSDLTSDDIDRLHKDISVDRPYRANRVLEALRAALNFALRKRWISSNPAEGFRRNRETPRERYITPSEMPFFLAALEAHEEISSRDALLMILLTGARKSEVLSARWAQFDLVNGTWSKSASETKQGKLHAVPLNDNALALLKTVHKRSGDNLYVFPGRVIGKPLQDVRRTWEAVLHQATIKQWQTHQVANGLLVDFQGLPPDALVSSVAMAARDRGLHIPPTMTDIRRHDLRHTFASLVGNSGESIAVLGALIGHSSPQSTARYLHFFHDPLKKATNAAFAGLNLLTAEKP